VAALRNPHASSTRTLALAILWLTSCARAPSATTADPNVAPEFEEFWSRGGGLTTYGPPISPPRRVRGDLHQTFLAVELVSEAGASDEAVHLVPLGWELGLAEPAAPPINGQDEAYDPDTGHTVYAGFAGLIRRLGGRDVAGGPISEVAFRDGQIVQYFENLGLVRPENASPDEARLIALGLIYHPPADSFGLDTESVVLSGSIRERPFASFLEPYGGERLFGQPLTDPYLADDGALEQIYERAVVFSSDGSARTAELRPIGSALGPAAEPVPDVKEAGAIYFSRTGHNVQWAFADFYRAHDGRRVFGVPLEEAWLQGEVMTQRFENAVLRYRFDLPVESAVQLAPLGRTYLETRPAPTAATSNLTAGASVAAEGAQQDLALEAALGAPVLAAGDEETILLRVTRRDGSPVAGASVVVRWVAGEREREKALPLTDEDGRTSSSWRDADTFPGEIINVLASARHEAAYGLAMLQYAYGYPSIP
jgi:hypothetical protein